MAAEGENHLEIVLRMLRNTGLSEAASSTSTSTSTISAPPSVEHSAAHPTSTLIEDAQTQLSYQDHEEPSVKQEKPSVKHRKVSFKEEKAQGHLRDVDNNDDSRSGQWYFLTALDGVMAIAAVELLLRSGFRADHAILAGFHDLTNPVAAGVVEARSFAATHKLNDPFDKVRVVWVPLDEGRTSSGLTTREV
ncbi:hypothetical protein CLAFUW4_14832 [Fulvia fulva]|nr:hypothetical protein CLAFUW4_14832 [Fulvia fulva]WPV37935.1 hypothetical protein CLAFUW7_14833 [Fulvia fulva]